MFTTRGVAGGQSTVAQKGTLMDSMPVLRTDSFGRGLWGDLGWPAREERLVTVAEAIAYGIGGASQHVTDERWMRRQS